MSKKLTTKEFIEKSRIIHGYKYDYYLVEYNGAYTPIKIICPIHGVFEQYPSNHLKFGCVLCNESIGENKIKTYLEKNNIMYVRQKKFNGCKDKRKLSFDFYLPEYNMCIEFDGIQHFKDVKKFGGDEQLKTTILHDKIKNYFCLEHNINILRIKYNDDVEEILKINIK